MLNRPPTHLPSITATNHQLHLQQHDFVLCCECLSRFSTCLSCASCLPIQPSPNPPPPVHSPPSIPRASAPPLAIVAARDASVAIAVAVTGTPTRLAYLRLAAVADEWWLSGEG